MYNTIIEFTRISNKLTKKKKNIKQKFKLIGYYLIIIIIQF